MNAMTRKQLQRQRETLERRQAFLKDRIAEREAEEVGDIAYYKAEISALTTAIAMFDAAIIDLEERFEWARANKQVRIPAEVVQ